jgi:hypothetical protein
LIVADKQIGMRITVPLFGVLPIHWRRPTAASSMIWGVGFLGVTGEGRPLPAARGGRDLSVCLTGLSVLGFPGAGEGRPLPAAKNRRHVFGCRRREAAGRRGGRRRGRLRRGRQRRRRRRTRRPCRDGHGGGSVYVWLAAMSTPACQSVSGAPNQRPNNLSFLTPKPFWPTKNPFHCCL